MSLACGGSATKSTDGMAGGASGGSKGPVPINGGTAPIAQGGASGQSSGGKTSGGQASGGMDPAGGEAPEAGAGGEVALPSGPVCVPIRQEYSPLSACFVPEGEPCPPGFDFDPMLSTAMPTCLDAPADCETIPAIRTRAYQHAARYGLLPAPAQMLVDVNTWPFCAHQTERRSGDVVTGQTAVEGQALLFQWQAGAASSVELTQASAPLALQFLDDRCVPLLTSPPLGAGASFEPNLPPGLYPVLVLSSTPDNTFSLELGDAGGAVDEPLTPIWQLDNSGFETCADARESENTRASSTCGDGDRSFGASGVLFGPESRHTPFLCETGAYCQVPSCPTPDAMNALMQNSRAVVSHFPAGLQQLVFDFAPIDAPICPECQSRVVLKRPSAASGVPFVDASGSYHVSLPMPATGSYRVTGTFIAELETAALGTGPAWQPCGP